VFARRPLLAEQCAGLPFEAGLVRALKLASGFDLDVRLVSYGAHSPAFLRVERMFA
jgi:hypothetical protein